MLSDNNSEKKNLEVLVAEDNPVNQKIIMASLKRLLPPTTNIDLVDNGEKALEAFKKKHYDLVVSDGFMPRLDGWTAVKKMREVEESRDEKIKPAVIFSWSSETEFLTKPFPDANDFIPKQIKLPELETLLTKYNFIKTPEKKVKDNPLSKPIVDSSSPIFSKESKNRNIKGRNENEDAEEKETNVKKINRDDENNTNKPL